MRFVHIIYFILLLIGIWVCYDAWKKIKVIDEKNYERSHYKEIRIS